MAIDRLRGRSGVEQRNRIRRRDCGMCQSCSRAGRIGFGAHVDHIFALVNGGTNDDGNLELLCEECHRIKSAADLGHVARQQVGIDGWPVG